MFSSSKSLSAAIGAALVMLMSLAAPVSVAAQGRLGSLPDFTELYERQGAAVVSVDVTQKAHRQRFPDISEDDPFYEFFRRFGQIPRNGQGGGDQREFETQSTGSGFIISSDGYIVTNAHVVDDASEVTVRLSDKREFVAKVIGSDKRTDVSLLKIDARDLQRVAIGDPDKLKVGEWVVAIGKPFGLENTMTAGIVSAKGRDLPQENLVPFIQTDVAINPGNSGGPLFNMKGEVVGINSLIYSRTGGFMGLAFAVPIDVAMNAVNQLKDKGRVTRGRIGVQIQELTKEAADAFGLKQADGALVNNVEKDGPAAKAGIESGDIILKVDGRDVHSSNDLPRIITAIRPGTKVTLTVWRKGAAKDFAVTVAEIKEDATPPPRRANPAPKEKAKPNRMGLVLSDLTDEQRKQVGLTSGGALVEDIVGVVRGNVQAGDVILAIIQRGAPLEVKSAAQVNEYLAKLDKGASVTLQVRRGDNAFYTTLKLGAGE
ncbi:MAG TPA: DegQ family serine endoprotease [Casimicrobiaceae bacterium]|nr:DegQ family serine endoprotease [Casimicrobiaceae bacterium]HXU65788.1 DegQ family serine endoprotease [Casimicrobiaceae bacterium]